MEKEIQNSDGVTVSLEIEGEYDEVVSKLRTQETDGAGLEPVLSDMTAVLNAVVQTGGGTRSVIVESLPSKMAVAYDAEEIVSLLTVLQKYDLVVLDGNTWKPGPDLDTEAVGSGVRP